MVKRLVERCEIRLSKDDRRHCELKAKEMGMSLSAWIRRRLMLDQVKPKVENNVQR